MTRNTAQVRSVRRWVIVGITTVVLCAHVVAELAAQTITAEIQGTVKDPRFRIERTSDDAGRFFIRALPVGEYVITVTLDGFKTVTRSDVIVQVGQRIDVSIALPLGERTETVTVTGAVPLLQTANAEISDIIDNRRVQELPLNG